MNLNIAATQEFQLISIGLSHRNLQGTNNFQGNLILKTENITKGAMTNTLKKLEEKQLITVEPDETSGRRKIVKITGEGRRVRQEALNNIYPVLEEFADAIGVDEIKAQIRKIQKVRKYVDDYRYR